MNISVNDFGASSTATAEVNTAAIKAAIKAANGEPIDFPDATYRIRKIDLR